MRPLTCDVAVIGSGIGGASVAAELARDCSVFLFEAEPTVGVHSTGRSAASYLPSYGGEVVRKLTVASHPLYEALSEWLDRDLLVPRALLWTVSDAESERAVAELLGTSSHLVPLDTAQMVELCPALRPDRVSGGALDESAMDIDVAALHASYLSALTSRGGQLHRAVRVRQVVATPGGWRIETGTIGDVFCHKVVDAAGAWVDEVAVASGIPAIGIRPKRRTVFLSPHRLADRAGSWPLVMDAAERWYFKPEGPAMLVSPADETDSVPCDARPDELAISMALDALDDVTSLGLRSVTHSWAGLRSFVSDRLPVVGAWPTTPSFGFLAGQGGYGIQMAPALAILAADLVLNGTTTSRSDAFGVTPADVLPTRLTRLDP
jgi:D-arginine dehydrogenase